MKTVSTILDDNEDAIKAVEPLTSLKKLRDNLARYSSINLNALKELDKIIDEIYEIPYKILVLRDQHIIRKTGVCPHSVLEINSENVYHNKTETTETCLACNAIIKSERS